MRDREIDLLVLCPGPNMRYLTGNEVSKTGRYLLYFLPCEGDPVALVPEIDEESVGFEAKTVVYTGEDEPAEEVESIVESFGQPERIAVDERMFAAQVLDISGSTSADLVTASNIMRELREIKDEHEQEAIREASGIADRVMREVQEMSLPEMTENELAEIIDERMRDLGAEGNSFDTIVASGPDGAHPHHEPDERTISEDDPVVIDFGCRVDGYCSDQTRTLCESPGDRARKIHQIVLEAQEAALSRIAPGVEASEVAEAARSVIEEAGFGDQFPHSTGHGVGVEVHESPSISESSKDVLKKGMAVTVEPGIYIEEEFGVRIEDLVLVTDEGYENLNSTSKQLN